MNINELTITDVTELTEEQHETLGWPEDNINTPLAIHFDDGTLITAGQDPEGNGPGHLMNVRENAEELVGADILGVSEMSNAAKDEFDWGYMTGDITQLHAETPDGDTIVITPAQDPELNGPGVFFGIFKETEEAFTLEIE